MTYLGERPAQRPPRCPSLRDYSILSRTPSRTRLPHTRYLAHSPHFLASHELCKEQRAVLQVEGVHGRHTYLDIYCRSCSRSCVRRLLDQLDRIIPFSGPVRSMSSDIGKHPIGVMGGTVLTDLTPAFGIPSCAFKNPIKPMVWSAFLAKNTSQLLPI